VAFLSFLRLDNTCSCHTRKLVFRAAGYPQSCVSSSVARARSSTSAIISSATGLQTTTLNGMVATRKSGTHITSPKSRSKPPKIAQGVDMTEDGGATDDAPVIGGLQNEDESLKHAAALASPVKGSDSQRLTKVSSTYVSQFLTHTNIVDLELYQGFT
jgi:hypothetical protein